MRVDPYSYVPFRIEMFHDGGEKPIGQGTAFIVKLDKQWYFVTNWHNVTGRHVDTKEPLNQNGLCDPDHIKLYFPTAEFAKWKQKKIHLRNARGDKMWYENTSYPNMDVIAMPVAGTDDITINPIDLNEFTGLAIYPSKAVSIIGYPLGLTALGQFPIWKKGHIASEPHIHEMGKPYFLIDATTRSGMSGSPVILRESGIVEFENNSIKNGTFTRFLGIYSGRLKGDAEIGIVWKPEAIRGAIEEYKNQKQPHTYIIQDV